MVGALSCECPAVAGSEEGKRTTPKASHRCREAPITWKDLPTANRRTANQRLRLDETPCEEFASKVLFVRLLFSEIKNQN
jgi:hypothetical protein